MHIIHPIISHHINSHRTLSNHLYFCFGDLGSQKIQKQTPQFQFWNEFRPHNKIFRCKNNRSQRGSLSLNESNWGVTGGFLRGYLWSLRCFFRSRLFLFSFVLFIIIFHFYSFIWSYFVFCCLILFYHLCSLTFKLSVVSLCLFFDLNVFIFYSIISFCFTCLSCTTLHNSNTFKPIQTGSKVFKPAQTGSRHFKAMSGTMWRNMIVRDTNYRMLYDAKICFAILSNLLYGNVWYFEWWCTTWSILFTIKNGIIMNYL